MNTNLSFYMDYITQPIADSLVRLGLDPNLIILGNSVIDYIGALAVVVIFLAVFQAVQKGLILHLRRLATKTETDLDDTFVEVLRSLSPPFYVFVAAYLSLQTLTLAGWVAATINAVFIIWVTYQVIKAIQIVLNYSVARRLGADDDPGTKTALTAIGRLATGALWAIGLLLILSNLGVDITSLVAGLGIGGIAIAFALQNILSDLFSSFAIYFDKPFLIGDFIVVGSNSGTVEKIGIKTTRLRALTGEELVISNKELTSARIQNFKRLVERRHVVSIGVLYETPQDTLEAIPAMIEKVVNAQGKARFDRAHLKDFGPSSIDYEIVYYIESSDYATFMDTRQAINLGIIAIFAQEGVGFAYPTQTVYLGSGHSLDAQKR